MINFKVYAFVILAFLALRSGAQKTTNNLQYPADYSHSEIGSVSLLKKGRGTSSLIFITDAGIPPEFFEPLVRRLKRRFKCYVISLPGVSDLNGYKLPGGSYSNLVWLKAVDKSIEDVIKRERLENVTVIGHMIVSTYLALNFSLQHPELIDNCVILAGQPYATWDSHKNPGKPVSFEERKGSIDYYMAPRFYKTVAKESWNAGMFQPEDYSKNIELGQIMYNSTISTDMAIMIQFLCEYFNTDISRFFDDFKKEVLVLQPAFDEEYLKEKGNMKMLFWDMWNNAQDNEMITLKTLEDSRLAIGLENSKEVAEEIISFISN